MRARSIPETLEPVVLKWFLKGDSHWAIAERLYAEHQIDTTAASVHRAIDRIARGEGCDGVVRTVAKLRMNAPRLVEKLQQQLLMAEKMAGLDVPVEVPAGMTQKQLEFINKLTLRELKVAGCAGREAERTLEVALVAVEEHQQAEDEFVEEELELLRRPPPRPIERPVTTRVSVPPNGQVSVASAKQGRNESCACGSGRKFKKCCGGVVTSRRSTPDLQAIAS